MPKAFAIYDSKSELYSVPQFVVNDAVAIRQFEELCGNEETPMFKHSEDFHMYCVGEFNENTGQFITPEHPQLVVSAAGLVQAIKVQIVKDELQAEVINHNRFDVVQENN